MCGNSALGASNSMDYGANVNTCIGDYNSIGSPAVSSLWMKSFGTHSQLPVFNK